VSVDVVIVVKVLKAVGTVEIGAGIDGGADLA
jgi:hypothetical protein